MAFDGIITKAISTELNLLDGARIDKIFEPDSNTIVLGFYLDGLNYALNICINPQNYRINLTTHSKRNPKVAPNFCMVLRKHLIGLRIKNIITNSLERIITIEFEGFDDVDDIITKKLIIELMGKHCNIILLDDQNIIIDSMRHINNENATHIVVPHIKYTYPKITKKDFLSETLEDFKCEIEKYEIEKKNKKTIKDLLPKIISDTYNGISKKYVSYIINENNLETNEDIYNYLNDIIYRTDSLKLKIELKNNDYFLVPDDSNEESFSINFALDDFYYNKESSEELKTSRDSVLKLILATLKKYNKRLISINNKLKDCDNMDTYRLYGELITANLYRIPNKNLKSIELENYYDENKKITIPLDERYLPSVNAKRFFKKYNKLKNALEIVSIQKKETMQELDYIESVVYELESANSIEEIAEILDEISENDIFKERTKNLKTNKKQNKIKKSNLTKNKNSNFNPLKYKIDNFTLLVGRNNKENDYLTLKFAHKNDIWFHTKDIHGSHAVLFLNNQTPTEDILIKCAEITAYHSKARFSSNVPVDTCEVRYVKKPKGAKPGMVIYTNYNTLYVNPKNN